MAAEVAQVVAQARREEQVLGAFQGQPAGGRQVVEQDLRGGPARSRRWPGLDHHGVAVRAPGLAGVAERKLGREAELQVLGAGDLVEVVGLGEAVGGGREADEG